MNINRLFLPVFLFAIGAVLYLRQQMLQPPAGLRDSTASIAVPAVPVIAPAASEAKAEAAMAAQTGRRAAAREAARKRLRVNYQLGKDRHEPTGAEILESVDSHR